MVAFPLIRFPAILDHTSGIRASVDHRRQIARKLGGPITGEDASDGKKIEKQPLKTADSEGLKERVTSVKWGLCFGCSLFDAWTVPLKAGSAESDCYSPTGD